ncbi:hypothetical protein M406DRAFT_348277 [Cryphonectria parasitica EP155]|uniref:GATA-type domain-containing protein n=1 Tax=Cryphonectria parasitica (strain ATCC 38755 / EP155) TaxID=660469 RepID=A0A9P4XTU7_CRYP1|nr:uncharacterized protein M406DRAFT_348277 [Cryphonectria parasitica EP155]KAF3760793.1 hypothetical protein M406DRAFT_348277 [Cryphonectria parasitica EP155]
MEVGNSAARQRCAILTQCNFPLKRDSRHFSHAEGPTMATATLMNPMPHYQPHHPPYSSNYSHHSPAGPSGTAIMSPVEPRRMDDHEPLRQSLPSIQEVIGAKPPTPAGYPSSISTSVSTAPSLPSPFATAAAAAASRSYAAEHSSPQDRHSSPRLLHNPTSFPTRGEPMPPFSDPNRPPLHARPPPPPPVNTYHLGARPSPPPLRTDAQHLAERHAEGHRSAGYPHSAISDPAGMAYPPQPSSLPPGQLPLSAHPMSPRYSSGPSLPSPYDASRASVQEDGDYGRRSTEKYEQTLNRHFEAWQYQEALAKIASGSRTVFNFADAYGRCAAEEQGPASHIPTRIPSEREVTDMINMAEWMRGMLDQLRTMVQHSTIINDRAREASRGKAPYEDEDVMMYGSDGIKSPYEMSSVKKRRGRAAPPGRCHSCNRIDTPEWRRGPDGARTLCNACGLHYAKLERKKQIDAKNVRARPSVERN